MTEQTNRFIKIGADGKPLPLDAAEWPVVADNKTGRMWATVAIAVDDWEPETVERIAAELKAARLGGFDDWRIPTVEELFLLADRTRYSPAIDTAFFPDCPSDWFWSIDEYTPASGCAWLVYFYYGHAYGYNRGSGGFVRAVRGGQ